MATKPRKAPKSKYGQVDAISFIQDLSQPVELIRWNAGKAIAFAPLPGRIKKTIYHIINEGPNDLVITSPVKVTLKKNQRTIIPSTASVKAAPATGEYAHGIAMKYDEAPYTLV